MNEKDIVKLFIERLEEFEQIPDFISFSENKNYDTYNNCNFDILKSECSKMGIKIEIKNTKITIYNRQLTNI